MRETCSKLIDFFHEKKAGKNGKKVEEVTSLNMELTRPESCSLSTATAAMGGKEGSKGYQGRRRSKATTRENRNMIRPRCCH